MLLILNKATVSILEHTAEMNPNWSQNYICEPNHSSIQINHH